MEIKVKTLHSDLVLIKRCVLEYLSSIARQASVQRLQVFVLKTSLLNGDMLGLSVAFHH